MSEELIKRLREAANMNRHLDMPTAVLSHLLREAASTLEVERTRTAPAVQVPDVETIAARWAAEWEDGPAKRRELRKLFVAAIAEATGGRK